MNELLHRATTLGTRVVRTTQLGDRRGAYDHTRHIIYLARDLTPVETRCTLAHELGHAHHGHEHDDRLQSATERQARAYAARLLISPTLYEAAEHVTPDIHWIAEQLDVLPETITDYQTLCLQRLGRKTYPIGAA